VARDHSQRQSQGKPAGAQLQAALQQAMRLHQAGQLAEADSAYRDILRTDPNHFDALHLSGVVAFQTGRPERAVELIGRAVRRDPSLAAAHHHLGIALCALGRFAEGLQSYDKAISLQRDFVKAHTNRGVALCALKRFAEGLQSYDRAIALKPDYAEAHNNRGGALAELERFDEALASFDRAIALQPDYAEAHNNRSSALKILRRFDEALDAADRATALKPDYAEAYNNRAAVLAGLRRFDEALLDGDKALARRPGLAEAHSNRGIALRGLGRFGEALASFDAALALRPDYAEAHYNKGILLLTLGDLEQGWREHEWRRKPALVPAKGGAVPPHWHGTEDLHGKTLLLVAEQGLGDSVQFCRYARLVQARGARIVLSVQAPLVPLLRQMEPEIAVVAMNQAMPAADFHCSLMSLPFRLGTTLGTIPSAPSYLGADAALRAAWAARLRGTTRKRIGLAWSGNVDYADDLIRSIPLEAFRPLLSDDASWISLQKEVRAADAASLREIGRVAHVGDELRDFADAAALVDQMDLVISVDTAIAHLAGALGKPVWILLPYNADWRWLLERSDSPWYPSARLYRQPKPGDWASVLAAVRDDLREVIA
jgi:tetratricopeptide (TPR) repeat protein